MPYLYLRGYHRVTGAGRENMGLQIGNNVQTKGKTRNGKREFSGRFPLFGFDTHRFSLPCSNIDEARFQYIIGYCDDPVCPIVFPPTVRDPIVFFFFFFLLTFSHPDNMLGGYLCTGPLVYSQSINSISKLPYPHSGYKRHVF